MLVCVLTAAVLYNAPVAVEIGHRRIVKTIHVICGYALPIPIVVGFVFAAYRSDMRRLNRFSRADWRWLRSRKRRDGTIPVGKFNAGQKLNGALSAGGDRRAARHGDVDVLPVAGEAVVAHRVDVRP